MDESAFQRACDEFVSREVYCCVSMMAEYILKKSWEDSEAPFSNDDIENQLQSAEFELFGEWHEIWSLKELEEWKDELESEIEEMLDKEEISQFTYDQNMKQLQEAYDEAESQLDEYKEILEYWVVSPYLLASLKERNEAVIESEQIWCRCTSGQAIAIDGVIREIVKEQLIARSEWDEEAKQILL